MDFQIKGLDGDAFSNLYAMNETELAEHGVIAKIADAKPGYPCRVTLDDAEPGERVFLFNYESHKAATPYRSAYAIYIRDGAREAARFENEMPPVLRNRPIALRIFNAEGLLIGADMGAGPELADKIRWGLERQDAAYIHAHNAMHGCFAAEITPLH